MSRAQSSIGRDMRYIVFAGAVILSTAFHIAVVELTPRRPPVKASIQARPRPVQVEVQRDRRSIEHVEEAIKEQQQAMPVKTPPAKQIVLKKPIKPPPSKQETPKPVSKEPVSETPAKPAPFVLSNVALNGGVKVQTGAESNLFGDPSVDAKGWKREESNEIAASTGVVEEAPRKPVIRPPEPLNTVKGRFPEGHRDIRRVVRVELMLTIDVKGDVVKVDIVKGDHPDFNDAAIRTVGQLRFKPATKDGEPIVYKLKWTVVFVPEG